MLLLSISRKSSYLLIYIYIYIYIWYFRFQNSSDIAKFTISMQLICTEFANSPGLRGSIPGRVIAKSQKWYLRPCSTLSSIKYVWSVKWRNPGKGVAPSPTPPCISYWKGSLRIALDNGCQIYLYIYIYIYIYIVTWYATERKEVRFNFPSPSVFELTVLRLTAEAVGKRGQAICTP